jgi:ADP-heptose:LPS heptosyltransferase
MIKDQSSRRFLIIQGNNFGDAVISTGLIEALGKSSNIEINVLTRPQFREIFESNPLISNIHYASFPTGTDKNFNAREASRLAGHVLKLRPQGFNVVSVTGDFRDNLLGWLISPRKNYGVIWQNGHPLRQIVRQGMGSLLTEAANVPGEQPSIYTAMQLIANVIKAPGLVKPSLYNNARQPITHNAAGRVLGFHMFASQMSKMWPVENWRGLLKIARQEGFEVKAFGSPKDRERIAADLGSLGVDDMITGTLQEFFTQFSKMTAVVCLDSFSIHVAHAIGIPSVMINGAKVPQTYLPPGAQLVDGGIRDISVERVWSALQRSLYNQANALLQHK